LRLNYPIATCILAMSVGAANADTIGTFDVTGSFATPATSLTGTLTVDETSATVTAADLFVGTIPQHFNMLITNKTLGPNSYQVALDNSVFDQLTFDVDNLNLAT
jgi:hypothetical protein